MKRKSLLSGCLLFGMMTVFFLAGCKGVNDPRPGPETEPLGIPQNLVVIPAHRQLTLTWDTVEKATTYQVQHRTAGDAWSQGTETAVTNQVIPGLENDTEYELRVRAGNGQDWGNWSDVRTGTPVAPDAPPNAPGSVTLVDAGITWLDVAWEIPSGATAYRVRVATADDADSVGDWPSGDYEHEGPPVRITGLTPDTDYYVFVSAGNLMGWSAWAATDARTEKPAPPGVPEPVTLTQQGKDAVSVSWSTSDDATMYRVKFGTTGNASNADYWPADKYAHGTQPVTITGLNMDTTYYVFVAAGNDYGWSDWAVKNIHIVFVPAQGAPTEAPSVGIGNRNAFEIGGSADDGDDYGNSILQQWIGWENSERIANAGNVLSGVLGLAWTAVPGALWYDVFLVQDNQHENDPHPERPENPTLTVNRLSYFHRDAEPGTRYTFWVRARNDAGPGPVSTPVTVVMDHRKGVQVNQNWSGMIERADFPKNLRASVVGEGSVHLSWDSSDRAVWYEVYFSTNLDALQVKTGGIANLEMLGNSWAEGAHIQGSRRLVPYQALSPINLVENSTSAAIPWNDRAGEAGTPGQVFKVYGLETTITGLDPDERYFFVVRGLNHNGERGLARIPGGTGDDDGLRPSFGGLTAPVNIRATPVSPGGGGLLDVTWDPVAAATGYRVFFSSFPVFQPTLQNVVVSGDANSTRLVRLDPGVRHYVWVVALDGAALGPPSAMADGVPNERDGTEPVSVEKMAVWGSRLKNFLYVEVNDNDPRVALGYVLEETGEQFFDYVVIFAANMRSRNCAEETGGARNHHCSMHGPHMHLNGNVRHILENADKYIRPLQDAGIRVLLGTLPDHDFFSYHTLGAWPFEHQYPWYQEGRPNPGLDQQRSWFQGPANEYPFGPAMRDQIIDQLAELIDRYGLDGFDIDDEWSGSGTTPGLAVTVGTYQNIPEHNRLIAQNYAQFIANARKRLGPDKTISLYQWHGTTRIAEGDQAGATFVNSDGEEVPVLPYLWRGYADMASFASYGGTGTTTNLGIPNAQYSPAAIGFHNGSMPNANNTLNLYSNAAHNGNPFGHVVWYGLDSIAVAETRSEFGGQGRTQAQWASEMSIRLFGQNVIYVGPDYPRDWIKY